MPTSLTSPPAAARNTVGAARPRRRRLSARVWVALATTAVVLGSTAAAFAGLSVAHNGAVKSREAFRSSSGEVASTLQLAIEHEQDLVVDTAAFILHSPDGSNAEFVQWGKAARVAQRYPELQSLGEVVLVPAAELPAFAARAVADPLVPSSPHETFTVVPSGERPFYCLARLAQVLKVSLQLPAGFDICAGGLGPAALTARDSGQAGYVPFPVGKVTWLAVATPIYTGGVPPLTVTARRAAFVGWVGTIIDPKIVLDRALQAHPGMAVSLRYHTDSSTVQFSGGTAPQGAQRVTIDLHNGWTVQTSAAAVNGGVLANRQALGLLVGGIVLSLLLGALIYILGTGRGRALQLVERKTGELRHLALHDALTGLPNRALILDRAEQALARARRDNSAVGLMFLDLDRFKTINDTFGHAAGDELLCAVAARLAGVLRGSDTVGRLGGDEFVVLIDGASLDGGAELVADRIRSVLAQPFRLSGPTELVVHTHASIGIAVGMRTNAEDLLRDADVALYEAKDAGRDCYVLFAPPMQTAVEDRLRMEMDLRDSVGTDEFFLVYQPTFDLQQVAVTGVEALLRWQHPTRGLVMPDTFIPIAEDTGLIVPLGRWVLIEACRQAVDWQRRRRPLPISVNVSARQLDTGQEFTDTVRDVLADTGLDPGLLTLEITESLLMRDADTSAQQLHALKKLGVRIAIDDFGTGYSSMAYLQRFPVDALKIDRSFISGIASSPESPALIRTLVQLGKTLGIETLAEGIEEQQQLQQLQREHCDSGQGYLFARPLSHKDLEHFIDDLPNHLTTTSTRPSARSAKVPS